MAKRGKAPPAPRSGWPLTLALTIAGLWMLTLPGVLWALAVILLKALAIIAGAGLAAGAVALAVRRRRQLRDAMPRALPPAVPVQATAVRLPRPVPATGWQPVRAAFDPVPRPQTVNLDAPGS